jgi:anti-sigma28 factor (negative regulator of flagellin synthesis)
MPKDTKISGLGVTRRSTVDTIRNRPKTSSSSSTEGASSGGSAGHASGSAAEVSLSTTEELQTLTDLVMQGANELDEVERVKASIRNGEYKPDLEGTARGMLSDVPIADLI